MNKKIIAFTFLAIILSLGLTYMSTKEKKIGTPKEIYRVYLEGKSIGLIEDKKELEEYIDNKQSNVKSKYNVNKVYAPNDLDVVKELTYDENITTVEEIYSKIKEIKGIESFTVNGYKILIEGLDEETEQGKVEGTDTIIYVLNKNVFTDALKKNILAFVNPTEYEKFMKDNQDKILSGKEGKLIEDVYVQNKITITKENIPTAVKIYMTTEELSKYLLFGTTEEQAKYTVKDGDTIEDVSYNNKISAEEFLIANTSFTSAEDLLFPGQEVTLGVLQPKFSVVEEDHIVSKQTETINVKYEYDDTQYSSYEKVKQEGVAGVNLVTQKVKYINGEAKEYVPIETTVLTPAVDKIIVKGTKQYYQNPDINVTISVNGSWVWPTRAPYGITSSFGYRWGRLHQGIDISGPGYGSPIYAANNGVVVQSAYAGTNGNFITIKHSNGYYTMYAHLANRYVGVGTTVTAGQLIGTMGKSGFATGVHLHFGAYIGMPYRSGSTVFNPLKLYR